MRYVTLFAVDAGAILENGNQLRDHLRAFAEREAGPLRAVILRINDDPTGYVFVPHLPIAPVLALLQEMGLIPSVKARPYGRLRSLQIEESYFYSN